MGLPLRGVPDSGGGNLSSQVFVHDLCVRRIFGRVPIAKGILPVVTKGFRGRAAHRVHELHQVHSDAYVSFLSRLVGTPRAIACPFRPRRGEDLEFACSSRSFARVSESGRSVHIISWKASSGTGCSSPVRATGTTPLPLHVRHVVSKPNWRRAIFVECLQHDLWHMMWALDSVRKPPVFAARGSLQTSQKLRPYSLECDCWSLIDMSISGPSSQCET
jgi:hypothetical protein